MKTYLYINRFKIEQSDEITCQDKIGGLSRTGRKQRGLNDLNKVENSVMYLAKKARNEQRNANRKSKRYAKRK